MPSPTAGTAAGPHPDCTLDQLLAHLDACDVRLTVDGDRLLYDAPAAAAGPALVAALRRHKPQLLQRYADRPRVLLRERATAQQQGLYRAHRRSNLPQLWNVSLRIALDGQLDAPALRRALSALLRRHHALHSRLVEQDGALWQEVLAPQPVQLPVTDLRRLPGPQRREQLEHSCAEVAGTVFDLAVSTRPALRLLRTGDQEWVLMVVLHHTTCDGWAASVLLDELSRLYRAAVRGDAVELPDPAFQSTEYARLQRSHADSPQTRERKLAYWAAQLAQLPVTSGLPTDRPRPEQLSGRGGTARHTLDAVVVRRLAALARECGCTPFAVVTAALAVLLGRLTGRREVTFTTSYANRPHRELETLVTATSASLPLRVRLDAAGSFRQLTGEVTRGLLEAIEHQLGLAEILDGLREQHGMSVPVTLPLAMTYQSSLDLALDLPHLRTRIRDQSTATARKDCAFGLLPLADGTAQLYAEYSADLFDESTAQGWLGDLAALLDRVGHAPEEVFPS